MWIPDHRRSASRNGLRYPSDLTDAEWAIVAMIPPTRHGGRKRSVNVREVLNGIFYVLWTGCQWKALPKDLPPKKSTVHDYLELWNWDGTLERIHHALYVAVREQEGREASPTVAIIDSQTAKGAQKGALLSTLRATTRVRRSQAAHSGRHAGSPAERCCSSGRYSRP